MRVVRGRGGGRGRSGGGWRTDRQHHRQRSRSGMKLGARKAAWPARARGVSRAALYGPESDLLCSLLNPKGLVYRRCSINICWLAKGVVGRGRIVREHVAEWMSFNYTQMASRLHDSHSGRQTPGTARPQGLDCSGLRPHRRGQGGNFPARGEVNARDCRTQ